MNVRTERWNEINSLGIFPKDPKVRETALLFRSLQFRSSFPVSDAPCLPAERLHFDGKR